MWPPAPCRRHSFSVWKLTVFQLMPRLFTEFTSHLRHLQTFFSDFRHSVSMFSFKRTDPGRWQEGALWPGEPAHQACNISCQQSCDTGDAHRKPLFFMCFLLVFTPSLSGGAVGWTKRFVNKSSHGVLCTPLEAGEETFQPGG